MIQEVCQNSVFTETSIDNQYLDFRKSKAIVKKSPKISATWTEEQYLKLINLVKEHGENWDKIILHFTDKTVNDCIQKFKNSQRSIRKGNWTEEEDTVLLDWVDRKGPKKWTECSKLIKGRCGKQCRERWVNILNPDVKKGNWSNHEQKIIYENLLNNSFSWSSIAKGMPGRTENSIKNYFYSSIRRIKSNSVFEFLERMCYKTFSNEAEHSQILEKVMKELNGMNYLCKLFGYSLLSNEPEHSFLKSFLQINLFDNLKFESEAKTNMNSDVSFCEQEDYSSLSIPHESSVFCADASPIFSPTRKSSQINNIINHLSSYRELSKFIPVLKFIESKVLKENQEEAASFLEDKNNIESTSYSSSKYTEKNTKSNEIIKHGFRYFF